MCAAYYNENDRFAAQWLRELIAEDLIAPGEVDQRSIEEVAAGDLKGFTQAHFFAGIGGWSHALRLAGWPDDRPVWTGSCPCQPLSSAGQRKGHADERHLWPAFYRLIEERRPPVVFGEQVASKDGREWYAGIRADLEDLGHACGAADLCAAGVGAPHIRQRIFWVAYADGYRKGIDAGDDAETVGYAEPQRTDHRAFVPQRDGGRGGGRYGSCAGGRMADAERDGSHGGKQCRPGGQREPSNVGATGGLGDTGGMGLPPSEYAELPGPVTIGEGRTVKQPDRSPWSGAVFISCADGKARRVEPSILPLAHGVSGHVGMLRGAGNAIVAQVGAEFIQAAEEAVRDAA